MYICAYQWMFMTLKYGVVITANYNASHLYWLGTSNQGIPLCWQAAVNANTTCVAHFMERNAAGEDVVAGLCPTSYILHDGERAWPAPFGVFAARRSQRT
jgi:hypothetical protein